MEGRFIIEKSPKISGCVIVTFFHTGDELIDMEEYTIIYTSYGLQKDDCEKAFEMFSNVSNSVPYQRGRGFCMDGISDNQHADTF